jgi:hypothetical protein
LSGGLLRFEIAARLWNDGLVVASLVAVQNGDEGYARERAAIEALESAFGELKKGGVIMGENCTMHDEPENGVVSNRG